MSDGDHATPGAAPWERFRAPPRGVAVAHRGSPPPDPALSCPPRHTGSNAGAEETTVLPKTPPRVQPARMVEAPADDESPGLQPTRKYRLTLATGRSVAALSAALVLMLTGGAWQWSESKNHRLNTISALDPKSQDIVDPDAQHGDEDFLIVGLDSRGGDNATMGAGNTQDAGGIRSDTIMLVNIPANRS
jgi:hypothetical protein